MTKFPNRCEVSLEGKLPNLADFQAFAREYVSELDLAEKLHFKLDLVIEEIVVNVINYGYPDGPGIIRITLEGDVGRNAIFISFIDQGVPFDPLSKKIPEPNPNLDENTPGGLGIFFTKQLAEESNYRYEDGSNILNLTIPLS